MMQRRLTTVALMVYSSFVIGDKIAHSADVDDSWRQTLGEGIEARQSAIHSLNIKYTVVTELTELHAQILKRELESRVRDGTTSRKEVDRMAKNPPSPTMTRKYKLVMSDGKIASSSADVAPDGEGQSIRMVFDGEILTALQNGGLGWRRRAKPEEALPKPTIDSLCQIQEDTSVQELLKLPRTTSKMLPRTAQNGDLVFQVTFASPPGKPPDGDGEQTELVAEINATHSFWPQHLVEAYLPNDQDQPGLRYILREVRCSDFQKAGSIDVPSKIEESIFTTSPPGVIRRNILRVDQIAINEAVDASEFVLTFPPGTTYTDLDGEAKVVKPDGTIRDFSARK